MDFLENIAEKADKFIDHLAVESLEHRVKLILKERDELKSWTDEHLRQASALFKDDLAKGKSIDSLVVQAFSVVNEAARRVLGQSPFSTQILAGLVIHNGQVAEMSAGEGKTLTETMPVYLNALEGKGVHLITTNDYLAERDAKQNGKLFNFLGLSVGFVTSTMENKERKKAYACDITYASNQEVGFDYLRDNLVFSREQRVLRPEYPLFFGIVDEIDSILIDESRTPLIIAQAIKEERNFYNQFTDIVNQLREDIDYEVDYVHKTALMTDEGLNKVQTLLGNPVFSEDSPMNVFYLDVCLKAKVVFEKDRDYIIDEDGVQIVDEFTGRVLPGRRFTDGVHQAIEAKEGVKVNESDQTVAAITFQNFFPMYKKLSGMSGTVMEARQELNTVYRLDVVKIPTNKPLIRVDHHDRFFKTRNGKLQWLIKKVSEVHEKKQPILIGTRNVQVASIVAYLLRGYNFTYQMLTAVDHREEAKKIAMAGQEGAITIATNMAGRGTDILLGEGVAALGGIYVFGTERHESHRIDDQLVGRSGRQGDPGETQFLISMEDEIMQLFGSEKTIDIMERSDLLEDECIFGAKLDKSFRRAQKFVENKNLDGRLYLYKFDSVSNYQRHFIYKFRDSLLENEKEFESFMDNAVIEVVAATYALSDPKLVKKEIKEVFFLETSEDDLRKLEQGKSGTSKKSGLEAAKKKLAEFVLGSLKNIKTDPKIFKASHNLILEIIDEQWSSQLDVMDLLKEEANLLSYAAEDPLTDFTLEARNLFSQMLYEIKRKFLKSLFFYLHRSWKSVDV